MSGDSNKQNMKYSAVSNQKDKYFLIHSVQQITGKLVHMRVYLRSCSYKQSTSCCATKTTRLSECEVPGKPLLALWIWGSHWWSVSLRRAKFTERKKKKTNYPTTTWEVHMLGEKKNHREYSVKKRVWFSTDQLSVCLRTWFTVPLENLWSSTPLESSSSMDKSVQKPHYRAGKWYFGKHTLKSHEQL